MTWRSAELAEEILDQLNVGVLVLRDGQILYANRKAHAITKQTDLIGSMCESWLKPIQDEFAVVFGNNLPELMVNTNTTLLTNGDVLLSLSDTVTQYRRTRLERVLQQISDALRDLEPEHNSLFRAIHRAIQSVMDARNFYIALCEEQPHVYSFPYMTDEYQEFQLEHLHLPQSLTAYIERYGYATIINSDEYQTLISRGEVTAYGQGHQSYLGVPLRLGEKIIGVMAVQSYDNQQYNLNDLQLLESAAPSISAFISAIHNQASAQAARIDELTGVLNRRGLMRVLQQWFLRQPKFAFTLMFIDLDGFKLVNDQFGHAAGDLVIQEVSNRLLTSARSGDVVARWGGDEFVILLPFVENPETALQIAHRLHESSQQPIKLGESSVRIGYSVGLAIKGEENSPEDLLSRADHAMYQAKQAGGYRTVLASTTLI